MIEFVQYAAFFMQYHFYLKDCLTDELCILRQAFVDFSPKGTKYAYYCNENSNNLLPMI